MRVLTENGDDFRADETGAADNDNLHLLHLSFDWSDEKLPSADGGFLRLDIDRDRDVVGDHEPAVEWRVEPDAERLPTDHCRRGKRDNLRWPRARAGTSLFDGQLHRTRDAVDRQVADHKPAVTAKLTDRFNTRAAKRDGGVDGDVEEVCREQVLVALFLAGIDAAGVDLHLHKR